MRTISYKPKYVFLEPIHKDQVCPFTIKYNFELFLTFFLEVPHRKLLENHLHQCKDLAFIVWIFNHINIEVQKLVDMLERVYK